MLNARLHIDPHHPLFPPLQGPNLPAPNAQALETPRSRLRPIRASLLPRNLPNLLRHQRPAELLQTSQDFSLTASYIR